MDGRRRNFGGSIGLSVHRIATRAARLARRRSLLGEILARQLLLALLVGAIALAALWSAANWTIRDDTRRRSELWLANLDELGTPLYLGSDSGNFTRIDSYMRRFPEISFVRYYSASGEPIFARGHSGSDIAIAPLGPETLVDLASRRDEGDGGFVHSSDGELPIVRVGRPIRIHSLRADGLLGVDVRASAPDEYLVGYVEVGLNFASFQAQLLRTFGTTALIGSAALVLLMVGWWFVGRRLLLPLLQLQAPLRMLAHGRRNVSVAPTGHRDISSIAAALNATVHAVNERDEALTRLTNFDPLTGVCSRRRFIDLLEQEIQSPRRGRRSALLFVNLDRFNCINDAFGHEAGDRLLQSAAARLLQIIRPQDTVGRFGGDEFLILLPGVGKKEAAAISEAVVTGMPEAKVAEGGPPMGVGVSVGATMLRGIRADSGEALREADIACRQAKANGRNRFHFYDAASNAVDVTTADFAILNELQRALKEDRFVLHLQPIVDIRSRRTVYHEVLLRMLADDQKLIPPSVFLPVAGRFGLQADIDRRVTRKALQSLAQLRAVHGDVRFTVNISGGTFDSDSFFDYLLDELGEHGVPLDALVIEITEQVAVRDVLEAGNQIAELARRGCRFAIDDFGSGFCSYGYLKALPVDFIKIDGSFIRGLVNDKVDQKIVIAIGEIAKAAGARTIAEHVEDHETFTLLDRLGVDFAQGYFLGKPSAEIADARPPALEARRARVPARAATRRLQSAAGR